MNIEPEPEPVDEVVEALLAEFDDQYDKISLFRKQLVTALQESAEIDSLVHSIRSRIKDRDHLRAKIMRKIDSANETGEPFSISRENLLTSVTDLAGVRILHLYTRQFSEIDAALRRVLDEMRYDVIEGPFARAWDDEYRQYFSDLGIETQRSPNMYTSVHYVVGSNSRTPMTCEIQVRTLSEELWGEVDHSLNYPNQSDVLALREQLKVLARITASATRLVDAIYVTHEETGGGN